MARRLLYLVLFSAGPASLRACSYKVGTNVALRMVEIREQACIGLSVIIVAAAWSAMRAHATRTWGFLVPQCVLIAFHPAFWGDPGGSDCGMSMGVDSVNFLIVSLAVFFAQLYAGWWKGSLVGWGRSFIVSGPSPRGEDITRGLRCKTVHSDSEPQMDADDR